MAQPFTVTVNDTPVAASAKGLPDGGIADRGHAGDRPCDG